MTRIKINNIPEEKKLNPEEIRAVMGGGIRSSGMFEVGQISIGIRQVSSGEGYSYEFEMPSRFDRFGRQIDATKRLR